MTTPSNRTPPPTPPYRFEAGAGFSSVALGNGAPTYNGGHFQFRLGQDFHVHPQHSFFLNGVFRNAYLSSEEDDTDLAMIHFGVEAGYQAWVVPDILSLYLFGGVGTNIFFSQNINSDEEDVVLPISNGGALALTLGAGLSIGHGILNLSGGFEPTFGLEVTPDEEFPWSQGYNPMGY